MNSRSLLPTVYPLPRNLERFWLDPKLYFSVLPRDILQYCLDPFLTWDASLDLPGQGLVPPTLTHSSVLTGFPHDLTLLSNGCFLVISDIDGSNDLGYLDPKSSQLEWLFRDPDFFYDYRYDVDQDVLYLIDEYPNNYRQIPHFSLLRTQTQFMTARAACSHLGDRLNVFSLKDSRIRWNLRPLVDPSDCFFFEGDRVESLTLTLGRQAVSLSLGEIGVNVRLLTVGFFGGYIMTLTYCHINQTHNISWFSVVESH